MMDYGQYTVYIVGAYSLSFMILAGLTIISCWQRRRVKQQLADHQANKDDAA